MVRTFNMSYITPFRTTFRQKILMAILLKIRKSLIFLDYYIIEIKNNFTCICSTYRVFVFLSVFARAFFSRLRKRRKHQRREYNELPLVQFSDIQAIYYARFLTLYR